MARRKTQRNQTPANNQPSVKFNLMKQIWRNVAWAARKDGYAKIADSIEAYIAGRPATELVEIAVPVDCCRMIASACANHGVGVGIRFTIAASSHYLTSGKKTVDKKELAEAVARVKEDLEDD